MQLIKQFYDIKKDKYKLIKIKNIFYKFFNHISSFLVFHLI